MYIFQESNNECAFTFLRNAVIKCVKNSSVWMITKRIERMKDCFECAPTVMRPELLNILQQNGCWAFFLQYLLNVEIQCSTSISKSFSIEPETVPEISIMGIPHLSRKLTRFSDSNIHLPMGSPALSEVDNIPAPVSWQSLRELHCRGQNTVPSAVRCYPSTPVAIPYQQSPAHKAGLR